jgi:hypothetical protein
VLTVVEGSFEESQDPGDPFDDVKIKSKGDLFFVGLYGRTDFAWLTEHSVSSTPQHISIQLPSPVTTNPIRIYLGPTSDAAVTAPTMYAAMDLSELERSMILKMRESTQRELMSSLKEADERLRKLTSDNRYLEAWNNDLIWILNEHDIDVPVGPGSQYPGTPSICDDDD